MSLVTRPVRDAVVWLRLAKPEGTLYEWLVSDFSVYDAFESGLGQGRAPARPG